MSLSELDLTTMPPFTLHVIEKGYLQRACQYLKIEQGRLLRVYYLCHTTMLKRIFSLCFWLFVHLVKGQPKEGKALESRKKMEEVLK